MTASLYNFILVKSETSDALKALKDLLNELNDGLRDKKNLQEGDYVYINITVAANLASYILCNLFELVPKENYSAFKGMILKHFHEIFNEGIDKSFEKIMGGKK